MENVCQKCGEKVNDANIAACQGTPEGGCAWKGEAVGSNPGYVEPVPPAAPKLTPADIEAVVVHEQYFTAADGVFGAAQKDGLAFAAFRGPEGLDRVTFCVLTLRNGAKVTGINHGPVSAANFSADKGRQYARESAIEKVWELEGYLLRERLAQPTRITLPHLPAEDKAALVEALRSAPPGALEVAVDVAGYVPEEDDEDDEASA